MRTLPSWQIPFLGLRQFPRSLTLFEIDTFFSFNDEERSAIQSRRGDHLRLAFGIHLAFLKMTGTTLSAVDRIPMFVLMQVSDQLSLPHVDIATVRSLYRRRKRTLYEHQQWAMQLLSIDAFNEHHQRALMRAFRPPVSNASDVRAIAVDIMSWLFTRGIRIPGPRRVQAMALKVVRRAEHEMASSVMSAVPDYVLLLWEQELFTAQNERQQSQLEWLGSAPHKRSTGALDDAVTKLATLRRLSVPIIALPGISLENLIELSQRCRSRRPSRLKTLREPTRTIELACFLRHALLTINDTILSLCDMRATDLRRQAQELANETERIELREMRALLSRTRQFAEDADQSDAQVRQFVLDTLPCTHGVPVSRAHRYRDALTADGYRVRRLLHCMTTPRLECVEGSRIDLLLTRWKRFQLSNEKPVSDDQIGAIPPRWREHVFQSDNKKAGAAFDCVVLTELCCALRNGSVWAPESLSFLQRDAMMIDEKDWKIQRKTAYRDFNLPLAARNFLQQRLDALGSGLAGVAEAVERNSLVIDERGLHVKKLHALDEDRLLDRARNQFLNEIGTVQFPQIIVDIDKEIRFSGLLFRRAPRDTQELLSIYGALLAHGTARRVSEVSLMMPGVSAEAISNAQSVLERGNVLRAASDAVVELMFRQSISTYWGTGRTVSSDGMSLDASRHLWNARVDPRRRSYGMGQYQHVLDRWGIIYNQPIVLGTRQAGAAIEGAVRQQVVNTIERIAVDTHGYTDFAMGLARLLGFDLCPRLKSLNDRLLHVPIDFPFSPNIASIVRPGLNLSDVESQWDELVRLTASIKAGKVTATAVLKRFGSVASGDPLYRAGRTLGRLERSIFLCDVLTSNDFRRELHRDLSHTEAVHSLQRKIYQGGMGAKRGRRSEEMAAISGSLTLLTNIVMAWNTLKLQSYLKRSLQGTCDISIEHLSKIAPIHHRYINFNGHFTFPLEQGEDRLFKQNVEQTG